LLAVLADKVCALDREESQQDNSFFLHSKLILQMLHKVKELYEPEAAWQVLAGGPDKVRCRFLIISLDGVTCPRCNCTTRRRCCDKLIECWLLLSPMSCTLHSQPL
jgi:hypothetical protein